MAVCCMETLTEIIQRELQEHFQDDNLMTDFVKICYSQEDRRVWLLRLRVIGHQQV